MKTQSVTTNDIQNIPKKPTHFALFAMKPFAGIATASFLFVALAELLEVFLPYVLKKIVDTAMVADEIGSYDKALFWVFMVPVVLGVMYVCWRSSGFTGMIWLTKVEERSYNVLYNYVTQHSHSYFINRFAGSISNKISHAAEGTQKLLDSILWHHFPSFLGFISSAILIFYTNAIVGLIFVGLMVFLIPMNIFLARLRRPFVVEYSASTSVHRGQTIDLLTNIAAARQYARMKIENTKLAKQVHVVRNNDVKQWRISEWILTLNNVIIVSTIGLMMWVMSMFWQQGLVSTGDFVLVVSLVFSLSGTLTFIGNSINQFVRVYGEVEEGLQEIVVPIEITDRENAQNLKITSGNIEWRDVTFSYEEQTVFKKFDVQIEPGQRVGLVGQSGAGKTTFVSLLLRQHDIDSGEILIDGQNIAEVTQDSLRRSVAVVPQEPLLFHRSIKENILYGKPNATKAEMIAVAKKAQAHEFIMALPKGYDTLVGERGVKLSGGQKQRVAIARAMLKNAPILVLDEATSALDSESEVAIQKALESLMKDKTVVAVAHRLSTLRKMDRILVMDKGKVVEDGTHEELSVAGGIYQKLWEHQAGGFILEDEEIDE